VRRCLLASLDGTEPGTLNEDESAICPVCRLAMLGPDGWSSLGRRFQLGPHVVTGLDRPGPRFVALSSSIMGDQGRDRSDQTPRQRGGART
jgi:hypothetical protein